MGYAYQSIKQLTNTYFRDVLSDSPIERFSGADPEFNILVSVPLMLWMEKGARHVDGKWSHEHSFWPENVEGDEKTQSGSSRTP